MTGLEALHGGGRLLVVGGWGACLDLWGGCCHSLSLGVRLDSRCCLPVGGGVEDVGADSEVYWVGFRFSVVSTRSSTAAMVG